MMKYFMLLGLLIGSHLIFAQADTVQFEAVFKVFQTELDDEGEDVEIVEYMLGMDVTGIYDPAIGWQLQYTSMEGSSDTLTFLNVNAEMHSKEFEHLGFTGWVLLRYPSNKLYKFKGSRGREKETMFYQLFLK